jgi:hypothetical protein
MSSRYASGRKALFQWHKAWRTVFAAFRSVGSSAAIVLTTDKTSSVMLPAFALASVPI